MISCETFKTEKILTGNILSRVTFDIHVVKDVDKSWVGSYNMVVINEQDQVQIEKTLQDRLATLLEESSVPEELRDMYMELYTQYECLSRYFPDIPDVELPDSASLEISEDTLEMYSLGHERYYQKMIESLVSDYDNWDLVVMRSGMYGGKSSCVFSLIDRIKEEKGVDSVLFISASMGESYVTGRGFRGGSKRRIAERFGNYGSCNESELREKVRNQLSKHPEGVIVLDEYTFSNPDEVNMLIDVVKDSGQKLILLGLDTNYLGDALPIFKTEKFVKSLKESSTRIFDCFSYVKACDTELPPNGRGTIRYLKIDGKWVLDLGLGQLVISKENASIVHYFPSVETLKNILEGNSFFKFVLSESLRFNSELASIQRQITGNL